ncbi:MAG: beta strand repeat-containing protein, partial [Flavobacteriia bacterium]
MSTFLANLAKKSYVSIVFLLLSFSQALAGGGGGGGGLAPTNDPICSATPISCGQSLSGTTVDATNSGTGENETCGFSQSQPGVWYVVTGNGQVMTASLCSTSSWDSKISVFSGTDCSTISCVGGNDDDGPSCNSLSSGTLAASYSWTSVPSVNYYILVYGYASDQSFTLDLSCASPPANDLCANSQTISIPCSGSSSSISGTTLDATEEAIAKPSCDNVGTINDVWYTFNTGASTSIDFTVTLGTASWIGGEVFSSCGVLATGLSIGGGPDNCDFNFSFPSPTTISGFATNTTYFIRLFTNTDYDIPGSFSFTVANTVPLSAPATPGSITGSTSLCQNATNNTYSIGAVSGASSYNWTVASGATIASGQGTTSVVVDFGTTSGDVSVTATNSCGTSAAATSSVTLNTAPATPGSITGASSLCENATNNTYSIGAVSGATGYNWTVPSGATIASGQGTTSVVVDFGTTSGDVSITATNSCGTSAAATSSVTLNTAPATPGSITGASSLCENATNNTYSIATVSGASGYTWSVPTGATIASGQGTTSVVVDFGTTSGNVSVTATNSCGTSAAATSSVTLNTAPATPGLITGATSLCENATNNTYSIGAVSGATSYNWTVPSGASIASGQGTTSVVVDFGTTSGNVSVTATNSCGTSAAAIAAVTLNSAPATPGSITGATSLCQNASNNTYSIGAVSGASSYNWTVPSGASIASGQGTTSVVVDFGTTSGNMSVTATNSCGASSLSNLNVVIETLPPTNISASAAPDPTCIGSSVTLSGNASGGSIWSWTGPNGFTSSSQNPTIPSVTLADEGTYFLSVSNACGSGALSDNFNDGNYTSNLTWAVQSGDFKSSVNFLQGNNGSTNDIITTASNQAYGSWEFDYIFQTNAGGSSQKIRFFLTAQTTALSSTNGYYIYLDGTDVLRLNKISSGVPTQLISTTLPSNTMNGTIKVIRSSDNNFELFFDGVSKGTFEDATYTTSSYIGVWNTGGFVSDNHKIDNIACNPSVSASVNTISNSITAPGSITGATSLCENATNNTYSIATVSGATSYNWTVPTGASIVSGQGSTSVVVDFGTTPGDVSVTATNSCGTSVASIASVTLNTAPATPGSITGATSLCENATNNTYSITAVSGASSYNWTVPSGASIASGQGTTSVVVDFGSTSGNVSVTATNSCGTSAAATSSVTLNSAPATPGSITGSTSFCENATNNAYSIVAVSGATGYTWSVPVGASIASGQGTTSVVVNFGSTSGDVSVTATNSCGASSSSNLNVVIETLPPTNISASAAPDPTCIGSSVTLSGNASGGSIWS